MPDIDTHCTDCFIVLGNEYRKINEWFDEFSIVNGKFDFEHRQHRHHLDGIEDAVKLFGEIARQVGKIHILKDMCGIPKNKKDYLGGDFTNWLYYGEKHG